MKIGKLPEHWSFAPPEQQIEGLKFVVKQIDIRTFEWSLDMLVWHKFISKSQRSKLTKRYRKIAGKTGHKIYKGKTTCQR